MNTYTSKTIYVFLFLIICSTGSLFIACNQTVDSQTTDSQTTDAPKKTVKAPTIPELLEREGAIAELSEWAQIRETAQNLHQKIKLKPTDYKAALYLAALYMQEARITGEHPYYYPASIKILDHVIDNLAAEKEHPKTKMLLFQALASKASVMLSQHNFKDALRLGKQAIAIEPYDAQVYGALCDAYVELGDYKEAVKMSDKMMGIRPDLRSYSRVSYLRELHGDYKGAVEAMDLAISAGVPGHENTAWVRTTLGNLYEQYGELDKAAQHYQKTLQERPNYAFALVGLGSVELTKGNYEKALEYTKQATDIIPEFSFYEQMAHIYQKMGKQEKVTELTKELLTMLQEDQESGHNMNLELANIHLDLGNNPDKALAYAQKEYAQRPDNITVNEILASIYYAKNDYQKAKEHIEKAIRTNLKSPELLVLAGLVKYKAGDEKAGKGLVKEALDTNAHLTGDLVKEAKVIL